MKLLVLHVFVTLFFVINTSDGYGHESNDETFSDWDNHELMMQYHQANDHIQAIADSVKDFAEINLNMKFKEYEALKYRKSIPYKGANPIYHIKIKIDSETHLLASIERYSNGDSRVRHLYTISAEESNFHY